MRPEAIQASRIFAIPTLVAPTRTHRPLHPYIDSMRPEGDGSVLVVDDDEDWREAVAEQLESAGFTVAVASDGFVAWTRFLRSEPLVVVTDIQMPLMDGCELLAKVRDRNFRVPVILVTASEALAHAAELDGAYAVIAKPADPDRIIAAVKAAIDHRTSHVPLAKLWLAAGRSSGSARPAGQWLFRRARAAMVALVVASLAVVVVAASRAAWRA